MVGLVSLEELEAVRASILRDDGQNVFSSMLEPCPFCGRTPVTCTATATMPAPMSRSGRT